MRANAVRNCGRYKWARNRRDQLLKKLKPWMAVSDEALWCLPPSQEMPRGNAVNRDGDGCPKCGKAHFKAPYRPSRWVVDIWNHPWQVQCRNCKQWFPHQ